MRTRDKLAAELRKVAAVSDNHADVYEAFALRAETGEFDDYADTYDCPITQLHNELRAAGFHKFATRVANGEFDATKEESDEWASSPSGKEAMAMLSPAMRKALGFE
jgi:predicted ATPase